MRKRRSYHDKTRRVFLTRSGLGFIALWLSGCGGSDSANEATTGNEATGEVAGDLRIVRHPTDQRVLEGVAATFSVDATGHLPISFQWRRNGMDIIGATGSSYVTPAACCGENGAVYSVLVSNSSGSIKSNDAILYVDWTITIDSTVVTVDSRQYTVGKV